MAMEILKRNSDYALRALVGLADLGPGEVASAHRLARERELAEPLLRKLLQKLVKAGLVESVQGVKGGFRLARPPAEISVLEAAEAVQGKLAINRCFLGENVCVNQGHCPLSDRLVAVQAHLVEFFSGITLADLLAQPGKRRAGGRTQRAAPATGTRTT
jgi:Rrf2 family protein